MVDVFGLLVLIIGASALTSTVCFDCATLSVRLTVCFCPSPEETLSDCCGFEALRFHPDRVDTGLELREVEMPGIVCLRAAFKPGLPVDNGHGGAWNRGIRRVRNLSENSAGSFSLREQLR